MTTSNQLWGLRPVRDEHGRVMIREVYYNSNGDITLIENSFSWPYYDDEEKIIETLSQIYPLLRKKQDLYNPGIINHDYTCHKWDFMTDEQFEQQQLDEERLRQAELASQREVEEEVEDE